jgi:hypothetical protein
MLMYKSTFFSITKKKGEDSDSGEDFSKELDAVDAAASDEEEEAKLTPPPKKKAAARKPKAKKVVLMLLYSRQS